MHCEQIGLNGIHDTMVALKRLHFVGRKWTLQKKDSIVFDFTEEKC